MKEIQAEIDSQTEAAEKMNEVFSNYRTDLTRELFTSTIDEIIRQVSLEQFYLFTFKSQILFASKFRP